MTPREMSARYAAYVWYLESHNAEGGPLQKEASRFSNENWMRFVRCVNVDFGRLLLRVQRVRKARRRAPALVPIGA